MWWRVCSQAAAGAGGAAGTRQQQRLDAVLQCPVSRLPPCAPSVLRQYHNNPPASACCRHTPATPLTLPPCHSFACSCRVHAAAARAVCTGRCSQAWHSAGGTRPGRHAAPPRLRRQDPHRPGWRLWRRMPAQPAALLPHRQRGGAHRCSHVRGGPALPRPGTAAGLRLSFPCGMLHLPFSSPKCVHSCFGRVAALHQCMAATCSCCQPAGHAPTTTGAGLPLHAHPPAAPTCSPALSSRSPAV